MKRLLILAGITFSLICSSITPTIATSTKLISFEAHVWADNWFSLYINGKKVGEDSVPITTERSFNSERIIFKASYPLTIAVVAKDYTENASGLEYIGKSNQQIGDAGLALEISEVASKKLVAQTDNLWKVFVVDKAPLNPECVTSAHPLTDCKNKNVARPKNWTAYGFKDTSWSKASVYTQEEVGVKEGYFDFTWSDKTQLIWSSDLKLDNTILLRKLVKSPPVNTTTAAKMESFSLTSTDFVDGGRLPVEFTCDGAGISPPLKWSGAPADTKSFVIIMDHIPGPPRPGETDSGNHFYMTLFNIPATAQSIAKSAPGVGTLGQNFLGRGVGYTPPCSQGPGDKKYTFTIYALSSDLTLNASDATLSKLVEAMNGKILAKSELSVLYSRKQ